MSAPVLSRAAPVFFEQSVDSTNLWLRRRIGELPHGAAVVAFEQSAGRGRSGRSFLSPEGGLYLSMLLRPETETERLPTLTPAAALAVCRAVDGLTGLRCAIKWPNDVLLGGKKICGILVESVLGAARPCVIVGVGVNANTAAFPEELREIAGSVAAVTGRALDLHALAAALLCELDKSCAAPPADECAALEEYRGRCLTLGREVLVDGRRGVARAVGEDYSLLVEWQDGSAESLRCGEVSVRGLYGYV